MTGGNHGDWYRSLDARVKVLGTVVFVIASALLTDLRLILGSLILALALAALSKVSPPALARSYLLALPFVAAAALSMMLVSGVGTACAMVARTSACIIPLLVMANGTESFDLFRGLRALGVPAVMTILLILTQRFIVLFSDELRRMRTARRARGFLGGRNLLDRYGFSVLANTAGMVLVRADARAERVYDGLKAKGFAGDSVGGPMPGARPVDVIFGIVICGLAIGLTISQLEVLL